MNETAVHLPQFIVLNVKTIPRRLFSNIIKPSGNNNNWCVPQYRILEILQKEELIYLKRQNNNQYIGYCSIKNTDNSGYWYNIKMVCTYNTSTSSDALEVTFQMIRRDDSFLNPIFAYWKNEEITIDLTSSLTILAFSGLINSQAEGNSNIRLLKGLNIDKTYTIDDIGETTESKSNWLSMKTNISNETIVFSFYSYFIDGDAPYLNDYPEEYSIIKNYASNYLEISPNNLGVSFGDDNRIYFNYYFNSYGYSTDFYTSYYEGIYSTELRYYDTVTISNITHTKMDSTPFSFNVNLVYVYESYRLESPYYPQIKGFNNDNSYIPKYSSLICKVPSSYYNLGYLLASMDSLSYASNGVQLTDQRKDLTVFTRLDYNAPKYSVFEESQSGDFQIEHHLPNQARFVGNIGLPNLGFWIDSLPFQWNIPVDNIDESYENYKIFISWIVNQPATQYLNLYHTIPDEVQLALDSLKNKGSDYVDIHNVAFIYNPDQNPRINTNSFSINTNRYYYQFNEIVESSNFENSSWTYLENENEIIQYFSGNTSNIKIFITWKMKLIDHGIFDGIMSMIAGYPTLSNVALTGFKMNEDFYKKINDYLEVEFVDFVY